MAIEGVSTTTVLIPEANHLDALSAPDFSDEFGPSAASSRFIVIDMAKVQFVDSSGLGAIMGLVRDAHDRGARVAICGAKPSVQVLFRMVQLAKLVPVLDTRDEAVTWVEGEKA